MTATHTPAHAEPTSPGEVSEPRALAVRRWLVIASTGLAGSLVLGSMFVDPAPSATGRELTEAYSTHLTASGIHTNLIHYGFALFLPAVLGMVGVARGRGAGLANLAAVLAVLGGTTLPGLVFLDFTNVAAARATDLATAGRIEDAMGELGWFAALAAPGVLAAMLALPVAALALWRAGRLPVWAPVLALVGMVLPNLAPWWLGFSAMALAGVVLAVLLARIPPAEWHGLTPRAV